MPPKSSLRETLSLAHTAECKLKLAVDRPDRNLRFVLGHALTLDSISLRLVEIENEVATVQQPRHASDVKFQAAGGGGGAGTGAQRRRRSPPPRMVEMRGSDDEDDDDERDGDTNFSSEDDQDELALTRFPSGSSRAPQPQPPPEDVSQDPPDLIPSEDSSDEEEPPSPELPSEDVLREVTMGEGNEELLSLYRGVKGCRCHGQGGSKAPEVRRMWEVPREKGDGVRVVVAEVEGEA